MVDDLNGGYLLERFAGQVYGVVAKKGADGAFALDAAATVERRKAIRKERIASSVPTRDWMRGEREKILAKDAGPGLRRCVPVVNDRLIFGRNVPGVRLLDRVEFEDDDPSLRGRAPLA